MCPLSLCTAGEKVKVERIVGGRDACCRLKTMGLIPGDEIEIVSCHCGPVILNVKGFRLGIGCGMARKIMVSPVNG